MKKPDQITVKLWKSLSEDQKKVFIKNYKVFLFELKNLSDIHNRIKAHNLAFLVASGLKVPKNVGRV